MVAPSKNGTRISGLIGKELSVRYQAYRTNVKGKDSLIRILFKVTRMLFYELRWRGNSLEGTLTTKQ